LAILPFDNQAAETYGNVRVNLERAARIGALDTADRFPRAVRGMTLITNNEREFRRVAGLHVENWLSP